MTETSSASIDEQAAKTESYGQGPDNTAALLVILVLFFVSGFCALVYQVVWQRMLGLFTGAETVSVSLITAACMLGMGVGSLAGGIICDKMRRRSSLILAFAASELLIGLFGAGSKILLYDFLYCQVPFLGDSRLLAFVVVFAALCLPTFFMGMTLPVISRAFITIIARAPISIAWFYALNTMGSAVGSLVAALFMIRNLGYEPTLYLSAGLNLICALGALIVGSRARRLASDQVAAESSPESKSKPEPEPESKSMSEPKADSVQSSREQLDKTGESQTLSQSMTGARLAAWAAFSALSGFLALGLEILWFRLISVMLKANSMTYGWLLFLYLFGLAAGTLLGSKLLARRKNPASDFFLFQALCSIYAVTALAFFVKSLGFDSVFKSLFEFFGQYDPIDFSAKIPPLKLLLELYVFLPAALIVPPVTLMGMSFVSLQKVLQTDLKFVGRRISLVQTANIIGSTLGSLFVGLLALRYLKTSGTLRLFVLGGSIFLFMWLYGLLQEKLKKKALSAGLSIVLTAAAALGLFYYVPNAKEIWHKLHGYCSPGQFTMSEDHSGLAATGPVSWSPEHTFVYVNGQGHSELPYGRYHSQIGLLPVFLHPQPIDVAVIGLGSGNTLYASGANQLTKNITCFEIVEPTYDCLKQLNKMKPYQPLSRLLSDKRIRMVFADGRKGLQRENRKYDVIEQDPLRPYDSGSGMLYSKEHFENLKRYLKPGGIVAVWCPTQRTMRTVANSFPYVLSFGAKMVGSMTPFAADKAQVLQRYDANRIASYCEETGADCRALLSEILDQDNGRVSTAKFPAVKLNHDLYPRDEYWVNQ